MSKYYTNPLSLTSQFFFCGLPLRLDSYRGCGFQCSFCFARLRGGNTPNPQVIPANPETLERIFEKALRTDQSETSGLIGQFLRRRVPIHFGGMSDPFQQAEQTFQVTRRFLETLRKFQYPTVISTRSTMVASNPYLSLLCEMESVIVQFSFTSTHAEISRQLEPWTPNPSKLLETIELLSKHNIPVTCRWQPYVPGVSESPHQFVQSVASSGASHISLEHLKLPLERNHPLWSNLIEACPYLWEYYDQKGAQRNGREYVLPSQVKLPIILEARAAVREVGLSFGAADNDFQYLSDSNCCCSGVDQFPGFERWFKHQIAHAIRQCRGQSISYESIADYWTPQGSVDRWLNSHSRIGRSKSNGGTLLEHIRLRWNNYSSPFSPASFYGVEPTEKFTPKGFRIFQWHEDACELF